MGKRVVMIRSWWKQQPGRLIWITFIGAAAFGLPFLLLTTQVWPFGVVVHGQVGNDYGIFTWNFWRMTESLTSFSNPFKAPDIYYPLGSRLTKHSYALGYAPIGILCKLALANAPDYPIYAYRVARYFTLALGFVAAVAALRALRVPRGPSFVAAVAWTYSAFFAQHYAHLHLLPGVVILPVVTIAVTWLVRAPSRARIAVLSAVCAGAVYFSEFSAFALLALTIAALVSLLDRRSRHAVIATTRSVGLCGTLAAGLLFAVIASPFLMSWSQDYGKSARPRASYNWRARPIGFVMPDPTLTPFFDFPGSPFHSKRWSRSFRYEVYIYLGYVTLLFAAIGVLVRGPSRLILGALALVFIALSLGPIARFEQVDIPLPYALLMRIPPFDSMRNPGRLAGVAQWTLCVLAAQGIAFAQTWLGDRGWKRLAKVPALFAVAWALAEGYRPGPEVDRFHVPPQLERLAPGPVIDVPITAMDGRAMFLQVFHKHPILTGYVSRRTPEQLEHVRRLQRALKDGAASFVAALRALQTSNVILGPGASDDLRDNLIAQRLTVVDLRDLH
jgi:hypothetical protein